MAGTHHSAVASGRQDGQQPEVSACRPDHRHASNLDGATLALSLAQWIVGVFPGLDVVQSCGQGSLLQSSS
jgi:hypothetical protein